MKHALKKTENAKLLEDVPRGERILVIRLRPLGDMVLLTPALAALHEWRPDLQITVLAEPWVAAVLEGNPAVSEIQLHRGFLSTVAAIRRRKFSIVYNQHGGPTSALLTAMSGAPHRVCWVDRQFSWAYNVEVAGPAAFYGREDVHTVEQRMTQFYATGLPQGLIPKAAVCPPAMAREAVRRRLAAKGIGESGKYAVVRPGATHPGKRWAAENFGAVARWLREKGIPTVVNLGPGDEEIRAQIQEVAGDSVPIVEGLTLEELMALLEGARLLVGNDCGPTHIAAAAGVPIVVIFGGSNPAHWRPWRTEYRLLQGEPSEKGPAVEVGPSKAACEELLSPRVT